MSIYYPGALAEFVHRPSPLTYSYIERWFCGASSVGHAMHMLGLPVCRNKLPILQMRDDELVVNLEREQSTLYGNTLFRYNLDRELHDSPKLNIKPSLLWSLRALYGTGRMLLTHARWIAFAPQTLVDMQRRVSELQAMPPSAKHIDVQIEREVLPVVIAVGMLAQFYERMLYRDNASHEQELREYITNQLRTQDWLYRSIADQVYVADGSRSVSAYFEEYGLRADIDYELCEPRWYEIPGVIEKRIHEGQKHNVARAQHTQKDPVLNAKLKQQADQVVAWHAIRAQARKALLPFIDALRRELGRPSRPNVHKRARVTALQPSKSYDHIREGHGVPVCVGRVRGVVHNITDNLQTIPVGTIGIFPNASPTYAPQYTKCAGMIFRSGGQTSHGSIVAREFGIPALIDPNANIADGISIEIDGALGTWQTES